MEKITSITPALKDNQRSVLPCSHRHTDLWPAPSLDSTRVAQYPTSLVNNGLGLVYRNQGKFELAEPLFRRALSIREQALGAENPNTARSLSDLAGLYDNQGKYAEAEPLYQQSLRIFEKTLGEEHPSTVQIKKRYDDLRLRMKNKQ